MPFIAFMVNTSNFQIIIITTLSTFLFVILTIAILCVQFFAHAVFNVVVDACPERNRRDEVYFLIGETVMLG